MKPTLPKWWPRKFPKWRPRKLISLIGAVALAFLLCEPIDPFKSSAWAQDESYKPPAYSYEGPIDPASLTKWKVIGSQLKSPTTMVIGLKDPNSEAFAMVIAVRGFNLPYDILGYLIYKDGRVSHFWLDRELFATSERSTIVYRVDNSVFEPEVYKMVQGLFFNVTGVQLPELSNS